MKRPLWHWPGQRGSALLLVLALGALAAEGWSAWRQQALQAQVTALLAAPRVVPVVAPPAGAASAASAAGAAGAASGAVGASGAAAWVAASAAASAGASATALPADRSEPAELRLARAMVLAAANDDRALAAYHALQQGSGPLAEAARFNAANLLLRQGLALRQGPQPGQAIALIELAKQTYRAQLRERPDDWPARYNLERAQRALPDPDEAEADPGQVPRQAERAVTTMRSFSPGLP